MAEKSNIQVIEQRKRELMALQFPRNSICCSHSGLTTTIGVPSVVPIGEEAEFRLTRQPASGHIRARLS